LGGGYRLPVPKLLRTHTIPACAPLPCSSATLPTRSAIAPATLCCTPRDTQDRHLNVIYNGESDTDTPPSAIAPDHAPPHSPAAIRRTPDRSSAVVVRSPKPQNLGTIQPKFWSFPCLHSPAALLHSERDCTTTRRCNEGALGVGAPSSSHRRESWGRARARHTQTYTHPPTRTAVALYREEGECEKGMRGGGVSLGDTLQHALDSLGRRPIQSRASPYSVYFALTPYRNPRRLIRGRRNGANGSPLPRPRIVGGRQQRRRRSPSDVRTCRTNVHVRGM
jgi:hypothetical protein